jgi:hypothetical protein
MTELQTITGSSQITGIGYDEAEKQLTIRFRKNGALYRYYGVPKTEYLALVRAESVGKFFHKRIRPSYPTKKLGAEEPA